MTKEIKGGDNAQTLSTDINVITAEINAYQRVAGEAIFEIGRRLKYVKENDLVHGEFGEWCKGALSISQRHANRFMRVFDRFERYPNIEQLPKSVSVMYALTTFNDEELGAPRELPNGLTKKLTEMSRRKIEAVKRKEVRRIQPRVKRELIRGGKDKCVVCGYDCKAVLHLHHIVPVGYGGDNSPDNLSILCPNCHAIIHSFLSDSAEKEYGLEYLAGWINDNLSLEGIQVVRELWKQRHREDVV